MKERRKSQPGAAPPPTTPPLLPRTDFLLAGLLGVAVLITVTAAVLLTRGGGSDPASLDSSAPASDATAIETLARLSIEVLPRNEWPSLYDSFTSAFQARCPREQFDQLGRESAEGLGADLELLAFKRLEQLMVEGDSATAVIVGELRGKSEYSVRAAFQREGGTWKLAAVPGTSGCSAFDRLSG